MSQFSILLSLAQQMKYAEKSLEHLASVSLAGIQGRLDKYVKYSQILCKTPMDCQETILCSLEARLDFNADVDTVSNSLNDEVTLLGFGEALHGGNANHVRC